MRISNRFKFIYLATPRTGSRTVRRTIDPLTDIVSVSIRDRTAENPFYHHMPARELGRHKEVLLHPLPSYTIFATARNPFTRVPSLHSWYMRTIKNPERSFEKFVFEVIDTKKTMFMSCIEFGSDARGQIIVDKFVRLENLEGDLKKVMADCGCDARIEVPHIGKGDTAKAKRLLSPSVKDRIAELYAVDIEAFGYG